MRDKFVITIGRQFGSGGRDIGLKLAKLLGVKCYDGTIISEAAKRSGLNKDMFDDKREKAPDTWSYALSFGFSPALVQESLFKIQSDVITDIAQRESCVIVGRSADYVLRNNPRCLNVFISAPLEDRVETVMLRTKQSRKDAETAIEKIDKNRKSYYNFYTDKRWGACDSYHLSIDSSLLGKDGTAAMIYDFATRLFSL